MPQTLASSILLREVTLSDPTNLITPAIDTFTHNIIQIYIDVD
jgi:hypothetical protein